MEQKKIYMVVIEEANDYGRNTYASFFKIEEEARKCLDSQFINYCDGFDSKYGQDYESEKYGVSFSIWEDGRWLENHIKGNVVEIDLNNLPECISLLDDAF